MIETTADPVTTLIREFNRIGVTIEPDDVPEVMKLGADTFLARRGHDVSEKQMQSIYIILNDLRK